MKRVLSVSLGSRERDHAVELSLLGETIVVERRGTNGDLRRAVALYREFDGKVDAFGVGGIEFYMPVEGRRYYWRDARQVRAAVQQSKVGDGNGVRPLLGAAAVRALETHLNAEGRSLRGMKVLKTTAVARYSLAKDLVAAGCVVTFGDFLFTLQLPIPLRSLWSTRTLGAVLLPVVTQMPYRWVYSIGDEQVSTPKSKWAKYYADAEVIAGDYLQIRAFMPADLRGKIVITNTTTARDVEDLRARGVHLLVTETPRLSGRSFGSNVIEGILLALMDKPQAQVTENDFVELMQRTAMTPGLEILNPR